MTVTYHGHSAFKLKGKRGTVVTDPYTAAIGFELPSLSADIVTVSHDHFDHNAASSVRGTARREHPFLITQPGEYELGGISVFGVQSFHDASQGAERGKNTIFTILLDDVRICHLGDLGHELTDEQREFIGGVDVLLCPVGGSFTIDPQTAIKVIRALEPSIVVPMHYHTDRHDPKVFADVQPVGAFLKEYGVEVQAEAKLEVEKESLPEETEVVVLTEQW